MFVRNVHVKSVRMFKQCYAHACTQRADTPTDTDTKDVTLSTHTYTTTHTITHTSLRGDFHMLAPLNHEKLGSHSHLTN